MLKMPTTKTQDQNDQSRLQIPQDKKQGLNWKSRSLDTWFWEFVSVIFSVLCFIAITCLLIIYNKKPSPSLPQGLTLNTIVSVLATASKSSLLCIIGTAIGQLKWIWFQQGHQRQLYHLQSFDDASRGPMGSLMILFQRQHPGHYLIFIGTFTTIIALAFDPFMQQVISYPVRLVNSTSSVVTATQARYPFLPASKGGGIDNKLINAMNAGLWSEDFPTNANCPSGNCT